MKLAMVVLLLTSSAIADSLNIPAAGFNWSGGSGTWDLEAGPIYNPTNNPGHHLFAGTYTTSSEQITCAVVGCGKTQGIIPFSIDIKASGFTLSNVDIKGTLYQTVYLQGSLDFFTSAIFYPKHDRFTFADSHVSGSLLACADPSCTDALFPVLLQFSTGAPGTFGASFVNGKPVISSMEIPITPEPPNLILVGTGIALLPLVRRRFNRRVFQGASTWTRSDAWR